MILPMKKISLITTGDRKEITLKKLRKLGILHIEITEGSGDKLVKLREDLTLLENALFILGNVKKKEQKQISASEAMGIASDINSLSEEKTVLRAEQITLRAELDRLKTWGEIDLDSIAELSSKGVDLSFYEMPKVEYKHLPEELKTVKISEDKRCVKFLIESTDSIPLLDEYCYHCRECLLPR